MRYSPDDFQGLTPALDARKSDKLFALDGRNYVFDAFGPRSAFGNRFLLLILSGVPAGHRECVYDSEQETTYSASRAMLFLSGLSLLAAGVFYTFLVQIYLSIPIAGLVTILMESCTSVILLLGF
jgi:hypothetical protein